jgi:hypothetical protein
MPRLALMLALAAFVVGCASTEHAAYISIGSLTTAVELSRQAFVQRANTCGCIKQSQWNQLESYYEKYQQAAVMAQNAIIAYKGATVPDKASLQSVLLLTSEAANLVLTDILATLPAPEGNKLKAQLPKNVKVKEVVLP